MPRNTRPKKFVATGKFRQGNRSYKPGDEIPHDTYLANLIDLGFAGEEATPQPADKATALKEAPDATR